MLVLTMMSRTLELRRRHLIEGRRKSLLEQLRVGQTLI